MFAAERAAAEKAAAEKAAAEKAAAEIAAAEKAAAEKAAAEKAAAGKRKRARKLWNTAVVRISVNAAVQQCEAERERIHKEQTIQSRSLSGCFFPASRSRQLKTARRKVTYFLPICRFKCVV